MNGQQIGQHQTRMNSMSQNQPAQSSDPGVILGSLMGESVIVTYEGLNGVMEVTGTMDCIMPPFFIIITPIDQKREFIAMGAVRRIKEARGLNVARISDGT
jgi:hypothetical protein